ncbi:hypothetical protein MKZ38_005878 [Zalerion maritima]|uniref:Uncharacterized protein n=1 Tax=Zalerion maritima TaxID=339359 RepID=A0AAD5RJI1_9PEZI|nr:hypothetical protein MKZ38_005878 [Zalerion maritima]
MEPTALLTLFLAVVGAAAGFDSDESIIRSSVITLSDPSPATPTTSILEGLPDIRATVELDANGNSKGSISKIPTPEAEITTGLTNRKSWYDSGATSTDTFAHTSTSTPACASTNLKTPRDDIHPDVDLGRLVTITLPIDPDLHRTLVIAQSNLDDDVTTIETKGIIPTFFEPDRTVTSDTGFPSAAPEDPNSDDDDSDNDGDGDDGNNSGDDGSDKDRDQDEPNAVSQTVQIVILIVVVVIILGPVLCGMWCCWRKCGRRRPAAVQQAAPAPFMPAMPQFLQPRVQAPIGGDGGGGGGGGGNNAWEQAAAYQQGLQKGIEMQRMAPAANTGAGTGGGGGGMPHVPPAYYGPGTSAGQPQPMPMPQMPQQPPPMYGSGRQEGGE